MIEIMIYTITIPIIQICISNEFWGGFAWGGISVLILYFIFKFINIGRNR